MATVFDIDFTTAADGPLNDSVPAGLMWSDSVTGGFVFSEPAVVSGAVESSSIIRVALNKPEPGNDYGDVLDSYYINFGFSAVPGNLTLDFSIGTGGFVEFGCVNVASDSGQPEFWFYVDPSDVKQVRCKAAASAAAIDLSTTGLIIGGANTAEISWTESAITFSLNDSALYVLSTSDRPRMHPFMRLGGAARITRFGAGDTNPEPVDTPTFWKNLRNATEVP